jgi:hypothetical protein
MGRIEGYTDGSGSDDESWRDDDPASQNPTGRRTRSSARTRRKKERRLFRGTRYENPNDKEK